MMAPLINLIKLKSLKVLGTIDRSNFHGQSTYPDVRYPHEK